MASRLEKFFALIVIFAGTAFAGPQPGLAKNSAPMAPAHPISMAGKTAEQYYKNIKVFKGVPASQIIPAMHFIAASLGVRCTFCHVMKGQPPRFDFASDDKRTKRTARKMVLMMRSIDNNNFHGRLVVTCATCHNGHPHPRSVPALAEASFAPPPSPPHPAFESMPLPSKVLGAYDAAIGGEAPARKVTTRILEGTVTMGPHRTLPVTIYEKAPNKFLDVVTLPNGRTVEQGTNGTLAWIRTPRGVMPAFGPDAEQIHEQANFYGNLDVINVAQDYPHMRVRGTAKIGGQETYILEAHSAPGGPFEQLYFDRQTGLLLRVTHFTPTPVGNLPSRVDFADYRDVDGIKIPYQVTFTTTEGGMTETFTHVSLDIPIQDSKFNMPVVHAGSRQARTGP